jgi:hypothetical protein
MELFLRSRRAGQGIKAWGLSNCCDWPRNSRLKGAWPVLRHRTPKSGKEPLRYSSPLSVYVIPEKRGDKRSSFANTCWLVFQCFTLRMNRYPTNVALYPLAPSMLKKVNCSGASFKWASSLRGSSWWSSYFLRSSIITKCSLPAHIYHEMEDQFIFIQSLSGPSLDWQGAVILWETCMALDLTLKF